MMITVGWTIVYKIYRKQLNHIQMVNYDNGINLDVWEIRSSSVCPTRR